MFFFFLSFFLFLLSCVLPEKKQQKIRNLFNFQAVATDLRNLIELKRGIRGTRCSTPKNRNRIVRQKIKKQNKNHIITIQITTRVKRTLPKHNNSSKQLIGMLFRRVSDLCISFFSIHSHQAPLSTYVLRVLIM